MTKKKIIQRTFCNGRATVYLGDCIELLNSGALDEIDAIITDPPYGINFKNNGNGKGLAPGKVRTDGIIGDDKPFDPSPWLALAGTSKPLPVLFFGADHFCQRLPEGGRFIVWDKSCGMGAAAQYVDCEFAWTNRRNARNIYRHFWQGCTRSGQDKKMPRLHVSQKPVELMQWCLDHCRVGLDKVVLDPYMGSGSTGVAAIQSGRRFVGIEIDRSHFETTCERLKVLDSELFALS